MFAVSHKHPEHRTSAATPQELPYRLSANSAGKSAGMRSCPRKRFPWSAEVRKVPGSEDRSTEPCNAFMLGLRRTSYGGSLDRFSPPVKLFPLVDSCFSERGSVRRSFGPLN